MINNKILRYVSIILLIYMCVLSGINGYLLVVAITTCILFVDLYLPIVVL